MAKKKKINTVLLISGVSLAIIFLLLICILNLWVKLSLDKEKSVKVSTPIESRLGKIRPAPAKIRRTSVITQQIERQAEKQILSQEPENNKSSAPKGEILIN